MEGKRNCIRSLLFGISRTILESWRKNIPDESSWTTLLTSTSSIEETLCRPRCSESPSSPAAAAESEQLRRTHLPETGGLSSWQDDVGRLLRRSLPAGRDWPAC